MLDVLMIGETDWANTGFRFSRCLRLLGLDVLMIKANYHPFMYPEQGIVHPQFMGLPSSLPSIEELIDSAKVIHFVGSVALKDMPIIKGKKYVVQHGGSIYRENHKEINDYFNSFCDAAIIQCPDLLGLGAKNEHLIYYPVDTDFIQPVYERKSEKVIIGHFPSNPSVKGTEKIEGVIKRLQDSDLKDKFEYRTGGRVSWIKNLKRMSECDIIIETLQPEINGKKYGEWGNTALEAAALGRHVLTNTGNKYIYEREYGDSPSIGVVNTENELYDKLKVTIPTPFYLSYGRNARYWVEKHHSMQSTAKRLSEKVYGGLL